LLLHLAVAVAGAFVYFSFSHPLVRAGAMLLVVAGSMGVGTNSHTSSHYATSRRRWLNELLTFFGYPFILGLSATSWWHRHVVVHHPSPNVIGVDDDADLSPWFARTRDQRDSRTGWVRFYYRNLQWLVLPLLLAVNGFNMQKSGWAYLLGRLRDRNSRKAKHWIDLACLVLHYIGLIVVPAYFLGALPALGFYLWRNVLLGYAMFSVLAPGHFPAEAACLRSGRRPSDFALLQTAATVNFTTGPLGRLFCSGLEYQIEHHLFPELSHVYYPQASAMVKDFCGRHGLPYRSFPWHIALWKCFAMFRRPPAIEHALPVAEWRL
jgi:linoleoyl-CoA desaturase